MTAVGNDPDGEIARLTELHRLRVLDSDPEPDFDLIAQTTAALFDVPIALVSLVDGRRQWFKAAYGLHVRETTRDLAFCAHAIEHPAEVFVVRDALLDERFAHNALVTGDPGIRFYAGAPLISRSGHALGTLCVIDRKPRIITAAQQSALAGLAELTTSLIERRIERDEANHAMFVKSNVNTPSIATFDWDADGRIIAWNTAAHVVLGWSAQEVIGHVPPFVLPEDVERYRRGCRAALGTTDTTTRLCTLRTKDGKTLAAAVSTTQAVRADGEIYGISTIEDFGARIATRRRLAMFESVVVNSTDAVVVTDASPSEGIYNRIVYVNDAFTQMTGFSAQESIGNTPRMLQGRASDPVVLAKISAALVRREPIVAELVNYRKDGSPFNVEFSISPVNDADGECLYFIAIQRDVTQRRALEKYENDRAVVLEMAVRNEPLETQLARIVVLLAEVIPGSLGTVMFLEGDRLFLRGADPRMPKDYLAAIEGVRIGPAVGSCGTATFEQRAVLCSDIATDERWRDYRELPLAAGLRSCWSIPVFGTGGDVIGAFALYAKREISPTPRDLQLFEETVRFASLVVERHRDRERLERMALYDALTGLPNRKLFERELAAATSRAPKTGDHVAVGILDIDRFKAINDAFGHHIGDELLRAIAQRLTVSLRDGDVVARMGGDEFFILFADLADERDGVDAAERLLGQFDEAFLVGGYELFVRPSFGLAFFPVTSAETAGLLQSADKAMYTAKARGGGLELATSPDSSNALRKLDLENDLHHALERGEFTLHYQMMFDLSAGGAVGAEALIRWNHSQLGLIAPGDFIPLAEANGTIVPIGKWVIDEATRVARGWQDAGHDAFVTVNVSALQFDEPGLLATVVGALERHGLEPHRLHLELTESLVMRNPSASEALLLQLKALGVRIVIDDFGTGYSSLAYLQRFSFDSLKIDRAFVRGIGDDGGTARSERIVAAVVNLGQALGVTTIAEGVEDHAQYDFVQSCGCDVVQGFLCARPVPEAELDWQYRSSPAPMPA